MTERALERTLIWLLRIGCLLCFVGHGAFGVITKPAWVPYFASFGVGRDAAFRLMPIVGWADIALGVIGMLTLRPVLVAWMIVWTMFTALLRPLAGEPFAEALERAGNYGAPTALLLALLPLPQWREWFRHQSVRPLSIATLSRMQQALTVAGVLLLVGHGLLSINSKAAFVKNVAAVAPDMATTLTPWLGWGDLAWAAALALVATRWPSSRSTVVLGVTIALWKLGTEWLFFTAGSPFWEVVERGGSYVVPLAIALIAVESHRRVRH